MLRRSPGREKRSKPRPGRLDAKGMEALRRKVFERDGYRCQHKIVIPIPDNLEGIISIWVRCGKHVTWESGHLAHIVSRGRGGHDTPENTVCKCAHCHLVLEHNPKPCPPK